jgi:hypothetical protein
LRFDCRLHPSPKSAHHWAIIAHNKAIGSIELLRNAIKNGEVIDMKLYAIIADCGKE